MATRLKLHPAPFPAPPTLSDTARAYDVIATAYLDYADGPGADMFDFGGARGFSDRALWSRIDAMLVRMWTRGRRAIRILDAGCGPGSWLLRVALRARALGFVAIEGVGVDISPAMIDIARSRIHPAADPHIGLCFKTADLLDVLGEEDERSFDIVLCLNGVINHMGDRGRQRAADGIERVCSGDIFVSAYAVGGAPPPYLADLLKARQISQDNERGELTVDLRDGRQLILSSHLIDAEELARLFSSRLDRMELVGLDIFHSRFSTDPRWHPPGIDLVARDAELERLEHLCETLPHLIDFSLQILFHARARER